MEPVKGLGANVSYHQFWYIKLSIKVGFAFSDKHFISQVL
jgi:hypothetical protein